jgi:uncharacterized protein
MTRHDRFLPDANIFITALNQSARDHAACRTWLDEATAASGEIFINDLTECAFLRICTFPRLAISTTDLTLAFYEALLQYPQTRRCSPGPRHFPILSRFITDLGLSGNDINDAWLAALAIEHRATLVSLDQGFARFPGLAWLNPAT